MRLPARLTPVKIFGGLNLRQTNRRRRLFPALPSQASFYLEGQLFHLEPEVLCFEAEETTFAPLLMWHRTGQLILVPCSVRITFTEDVTW